ncbi:MAG: VOC family protein [Planctomycetota bacterium]
MHGDFTWTDLSALDLKQATAFYGQVLNWQVVDDAEGDSGAGYRTCVVGGEACAGLFSMPAFFRQIKMPSFWMTYIAVDDVDAVVAQAKELGAKVELEDTNPLGRIALIRDPAGAGFTCYQGDAPSAVSPDRQPGRWAWSELFVSDLAAVQTFYETLFGWSFHAETDDPGRYAIHNRAGKRIGALQVAANDVKGDKEYWVPFFAVANLDQAARQTQALGGQILNTHTNIDGTHHLIQDPQGAACYLTAPGSADRVLENNQSSVGQRKASVGGRSVLAKWRTILGLILVYVAVLSEASWVWGVLFLIWVLPDLKTGTTYFIEPVPRREHPALYWIIVVTWIAMSAYMLAAGLWPGIANG